MNIVAAIYFHPEAFPPTLNAIGELSQLFENIYLLHRPHLENGWNFSNNVELFPSGRYMAIRDQEKSSLFNKIGIFFGFTKRLYNLIRRNNPKVILLYDSIPLFSYYLIKGFIRHKPIIWYHNHDVSEKEKLRKFSIAWLAVLFEPKMFPYINIFSLPSEERKKYFPMNLLKGKYFFIPNLPSRKFYSKFRYICKEKTCIKILFQGSIGFFHGIKELMELIPFQINGKSIQLVLKGFLKEPFKTELYKAVNERSIGDHIEILGVTSYSDVPKITSSCHIGIAIFTKKDIMNKTLGTASNKIYEYAACGLPVLYYDDEYFRKHLSKYKWALPTDLTKKSLINSIKFIDSNYVELSEAARSDFENELYFEKKFKELSQHLTQIIKS